MGHRPCRGLPIQMGPRTVGRRASILLLIQLGCLPQRLALGAFINGLPPMLGFACTSGVVFGLRVACKKNGVPTEICPCFGQAMGWPKSSAYHRLSIMEAQCQGFARGACTNWLPPRLGVALTNGLLSLLHKRTSLRPTEGKTTVSRRQGLHSHFSVLRGGRVCTSILPPHSDGSRYLAISTFLETKRVVGVAILSFPKMARSMVSFHFSIRR